MDRNLRPVRSPDVNWMALEAGGVLVRSDDQNRFALDELGLIIWDRCTGEWNVGDLADAVARLFDIDDQRALDDVTGFLRQLRDRDLIRLEHAAPRARRQPSQQLLLM